MLAYLNSIVVTNADATSGHLHLGRNHVMALQAEWPAGIVGTIKVQVTMSGVRWEDIPDSTVTLDGSAGGQMWNYTQAGASKARLYVTYSSGGGTIAITADAKGVR